MNDPIRMTKGTCLQPYVQTRFTGGAPGKLCAGRKDRRRTELQPACGPRLRCGLILGGRLPGSVAVEFDARKAHCRGERRFLVRDAIWVGGISTYMGNAEQEVRFPCEVQIP